ncbi:MAG TPA: extracellular solute-binding protein [Chloroflexota bacterium]|nr:extracellular solute-binding protein [Chloroflexota bacterium]
MKTKLVGLPGPKLSRRRLLATTVGMAGLTLTSCTRSASSPPAYELTLVAREQPLAAVQQLLARQVAEAADQRGVRLSIQSMLASDLRTKLGPAAAAKQLPDLALVGDFDFAALAAHGFLVNVRPVLQRIVGLNGELFSPLGALVAAGPFEDLAPDAPDPAWAIPLSSRGSGLLVRQDLLAPKNLLPPKTVDDARQAAQRLTDPTRQIYGWGTPLPIADATEHLLRVMLLAYGAPVFDSLGFRVTLDPAAAATALSAVASLYRDDRGMSLAPTGVVDLTAAQAIDLYIAGQVGQLFDPGGYYAQIVARDATFRLNTIVVPLPSGPRGWFTATATDLLIASKAGQAPDVALSLVEAWLQPSAFAALARAGAGAFVPPYAYATKDAFWDEDPNYAALALNARGDPPHKIQYAGIGYPGPPTLVAAVVEAALPFVDAARSVVRDGQAPVHVAATLYDRCLSLAQRALAGISGGSDDAYSANH